MSRGLRLNKKGNNEGTAAYTSVFRRIEIPKTHKPRYQSRISQVLNKREKKLGDVEAHRLFSDPSQLCRSSESLTRDDSGTQNMHDLHAYICAAAMMHACVQACMQKHGSQAYASIRVSVDKKETAHTQIGDHTLILYVHCAQLRQDDDSVHRDIV